MSDIGETVNSLRSFATRQRFRESYDNLDANFLSNFVEVQRRNDEEIIALTSVLHDRTGFLESYRESLVSSGYFKYLEQGRISNCFIIVGMLYHDFVKKAKKEVVLIPKRLDAFDDYWSDGYLVNAL